jgi:hypothetical protein
LSERTFEKIIDPTVHKLEQRHEQKGQARSHDVARSGDGARGTDSGGVNGDGSRAGITARNTSVDPSHPQD